MFDSASSVLESMCCIFDILVFVYRRISLDFQLWKFLFCLYVRIAFSIFFFSSLRRLTRCALVTGVQTFALPISMRLKAIEDAPALDMTPEDMGERIAAAAQKAREGDRAGVQQVQQSQVDAVQALHRIIGNAHTREQQRELIWWGI